MNKTKILYFSISTLAILYVFIRLFSVGITYDEVWTIYEFVPQTVKNIFAYNPCDANNHIINTLAVKFLFYIFGESIFVARLPNFFAFFLFLFYAYKISNKYLSEFNGVLCFCLLIVNPFLLDFFSLARGYGISMGFLLPSIYYLLEFIEYQNPIKSFNALLFGGIATITNFSMLNYYLILLLVIFIIMLFSKKQNI